MVGYTVWILRCLIIGLLAATLLHPHTGDARSRTDDKRHATTTHAHAPSHAKHQTAATTAPRRGAAARKAEPAAALARRPLIVIDPGHGGRDPGAIGVSGTPEKTVTLAAAQELRRLLQATGRYRVALTRTKDTTLGLDTRLAFARSLDADLLIAIHADASPNRSARGASVYVRGGNSGHVAGVQPAPNLIPQAPSAFLQSSLIEQLDDDVRLVATPARSARLHVLASRAMPSVLLEMGFLSNRHDEALLRQPAHRLRLVRAVRDAIGDYFAALRAGGRT